MSNTIAQLKSIEADIRNLESARKQLYDQFQREMTDKHSIHRNNRLCPTKAFRKLFADTFPPKSVLRWDWFFVEYEVDEMYRLTDRDLANEVRVPLVVTLDMHKKAAKR